MGILLPNCTHYVLGLLGAMEAGLTVTTLNPAYTMAEIARQLEMSDAKIILTDKTRLQPVQDALRKIGMHLISMRVRCNPLLLKTKDTMFHSFVCHTYPFNIHSLR